MFKENTFDFFIDIFLLGIIQKVRNGREWSGICCLFRDKPLRNFQVVGGVKLTPFGIAKKIFSYPNKKSCIFEYFE